MAAYIKLQIFKAFMIPYSILDLAPITEGSDASTALHNSLDLAQHAEQWGYKRFWLAEHHNMPGIASAATAVVIGYIAGNTKSIKVGSGGVMLPNHSPLVIAEQFGTLETLYPGRIDLGLGRAPGTDQKTAQALRHSMDAAENFPRDVQELQAYFSKNGASNGIKAVPGTGTNVPIWLLGSSLFSAQLAAILGLPFAFASHFAPQMMEEAIRVYRDEFRASKELKKPHLMLAVNTFAADTDDEAKYHFTSLQQQFINLRRGNPGKMPPPVDNILDYCSPAEERMIGSALKCSAIGSKETVKNYIRDFIDMHQPDELITTAMMYSHEARLRSFELVSEIMEELYKFG
jgi:luciferase family oxidoreductase group 1